MSSVNNQLSASNANSSAVAMSTARYTSAGYSPHMQMAAAVAAQQQFTMPTESTGSTDDWYGKGFAGSLRMNPLQYQA